MENCRTSWLSAMLKIVSPVLDALERGELKTSLPLGFHPDRADFAPLEAFGRSLLGLAPSDAFWAGPDEDWTGKKLWSGGHVSIDHAID